MTTPDHDQLEASAIAAIRQSERPVNAAQILESMPPDLRVPRALIEPILAAAAAKGAVFLWPPYLTRGKRYWMRSAEEHAASRLPELLANQALTLRDLEKSLARDLGGHTAAKRKAMIRAGIASLKTRGSLYEYPKLGRTEPKFSLQPADAAPYLKALKKEFDALALKLEAAGVTREQIASELVNAPATAPSEKRTPDLRDTILQRLTGRPGGISIRELRAALPASSKDDFDHAILSLYRSNRVFLDRHDRPAILSDSEREELVFDGAGSYYIGIALRGDGGQSLS